MRENVVTGKRAQNRSYVLMLVFAGLLIAVEIILERYLEIPVGATSRYSLAFVARAISGAVLGPIGAGITGLLSDVIGATIKFGSPIWLLSVSAFVRGAIYGIFLHKHCTPIRIILAVLSVEGICSILLNSLILHAAMGTSLNVLFFTRSIQAGIMTVVQIPVLLMMNQYLFPVLKKMLAQYRER